MPHLPQEFRPAPGQPAPPTLAPTLPPEPAPSPVKPEPTKERPNEPRYRTYREKKAALMPRLSVFDYEPNQREIISHMLYGGLQR